MPKLTSTIVRSLVLLVCFTLCFRAFAGQWPEKLTGHGGPVKSITVSADGKRALTASFDYTLILWDLTKAESEIIHIMEAHDAPVNDVEFLRDGNRAVSVSDDGSFGIWNLNNGEIISRLKGDVAKVLDVSVSSDGKIAADARWDSTVHLYDLEKQEKINVIRGHQGKVNSVVFSLDGNRLYSAASDGRVVEWDALTGAYRRQVYSHGWGINSIALIDRDTILIGSSDGVVGLISINQDEPVEKLFKSDLPIQSIKVSTNGKYFGFGDGTGKIGVFSAESLELIEIGQVTHGPVWDFDFLPGAKQVYHVGLDDFGALWKIEPKEFAQIKSEIPRRFQVSNMDDVGELEFQRKCSVCHTLLPDDGNRAGPTLYQLFGRKAGSLPDYTYSQALLDSNVIWTEETIGKLFDIGPDVMLPGTKMPIQRLKNIERRDELIRFLKVSTMRERNLE